LLLVRWQLSGSQARDSLPPAGAPLRVARAIDGDTLLLESGHRIRLIGVDTPESKHPDRPPEPWGEEAARHTQERIAGRTIVLEYDRERLDPYRRVLAYVSIDGVLLNEALIHAGFSRAVTTFAYRGDMQRRFRVAEQSARDAARGIWSVPADSPR
jgi:micrococcal nuclease